MKKPNGILLILTAAAGLCGLSQSVSGAATSDADAPYSVVRTLKIGGSGGWDYATLDEAGKNLYLTRSTHTMVVAVAEGKTVADIAGGGRTHGVALVPKLNRGFITDGKNASIIIFDIKTNQVLGTVPAAEDADGIIYDAGSDKLLIACGDAGVLVPLAPDVDPKSGKSDKPIELGGKPEFLAADGQGKAYVNLEDKAAVAQVDLKSGQVLNRWPIAPGDEPTGLAIDAEKGRLYVGCRNQKMIILNTKDGSLLADLPIGRSVDATAFDHGVGLASCGDGTITVVSETSPGKFAVAQTVKTALGARTMAVDHATGTIYLPTAEMGPDKDQRGRPKPVAGTFKVLVVGRDGK